MNCAFDVGAAADAVRKRHRLPELSDYELRDAIDGYLKEYSKKTGYLSVSERAAVSGNIFSEIRGFGPLDLLLRDDDITEIMINGPENIFIEKNGRLEKTGIAFENAEKLETVIQRIVSMGGREVNAASPIVDTRLPDGSRVNVVLPPVSLSGPVMTVRRFTREAMTLERLIEWGALDADCADFIRKLVKAKYNIFISGGTGSGKTTLLNALAGEIDPGERIITVEDSAELRIPRSDNIVRMETRNANSTGCGCITIRDLIKTSLRMRPERIIVGEVRGAEALDMLQAMNTGHDGSLSTGHANSTEDMLARLETMVLTAESGLPIEAVRNQISSAIDIIIHLSRSRDGSRRITEVSETCGIKDGNIILNRLYVYSEKDKRLQRTGNEFFSRKKLERAGFDYEETE